jgi:hypothetical protein
MSLTFEALREANAKRHQQHHHSPALPDEWSHDDWLVAIGSGVGNALDVLRGVNRVRLGVRGGDPGWEPLLLHLGDALAHVVITLDIFAMNYATRLGRESAFAIGDFHVLRRSTHDAYGWTEPNMRNLSNAGRGLMTMTGRLADMVPRTRQEGAEACNWVLSKCDAIAFCAGIDLGAAVIGTFNAASEKSGYPERLAA